MQETGASRILMTVALAGLPAVSPEEEIRGAGSPALPF